MERPITRQRDQSDYVEAYLDGLTPPEYIYEAMDPHIVEKEGRDVSRRLLVA